VCVSKWEARRRIGIHSSSAFWADYSGLVASAWVAPSHLVVPVVQVAIFTVLPLDFFFLPAPEMFLA
jgi:hypothetical protein